MLRWVIIKRQRIHDLVNVLVAAMVDASILQMNCMETKSMRKEEKNSRVCSVTFSPSLKILTKHITMNFCSLTLDNLEDAVVALIL